MKIVYISNYRDGTGWSKAGLGHIMALHSIGADVYPRFIKFNNYYDPDVPEVVQELEHKKCDKPDVIVQHVLPHLFVKSEFKSVLHFAFETHSFNKSGWDRYIKLADSVWATNKRARLDLQTNHDHVSYVPHAFDTEVYKKKYAPIDRPGIRNKCVFYYIGEVTHKKNIAGILTAFHSVFRASDPVELVLKVSSPGRSESEVFELVHQIDSQCKQNLRIFDHPNRFKKPKVITERMSDQDIMQLHATCHVFVTSSYGEGCCIPAFDAVAMGNRAIVPKSMGFNDYCNCHNATRIETVKTVCSGAHDALANLFTGLDTWDQVSLSSMAESMRYHADTHTTEKKQDWTHIQRFSYEHVGAAMLEELSCLVK